MARVGGGCGDLDLVRSGPVLLGGVVENTSGTYCPRTDDAQCPRTEDNQ